MAAGSRHARPRVLAGGWLAAGAWEQALRYAVGGWVG